MMSKKVVTVNQLNFSYDKVPVLRQIKLAVERSEFVTILGPNGSGKSTLLKHLGRLLLPPEQTIFLDGADIKQLTTKQVAKQVSLLSQHNYYDYDYSCYDIVMMGRFVHMNALKGESKRDVAIVEQSMRATDTWQFRNRAITELSGGNVKRYAKEHNKTIIAVLHDLNFALRFSDRLILLSQGKILSSGTPEAVLTVENIKKAYDIDVTLEKKNGKLYYVMPMLDA